MLKNILLTGICSFKHFFANFRRKVNIVEERHGAVKGRSKITQVAYVFFAEYAYYHLFIFFSKHGIVSHRTKDYFIIRAVFVKNAANFS